MKKIIYIFVIIFFVSFLYAEKINNCLSISGSYAFVNSKNFNEALSELEISTINGAMIYNISDEIEITDLFSFIYGFEFLQFFNNQLDIYSFQLNIKSIMVMLSINFPVIDRNFTLKGSIGPNIGIFNATKGKGNGIFTTNILHDSLYSTIIYSGKVECKLMHIENNITKCLFVGFMGGYSPKINVDYKGDFETNNYLLDINNNILVFDYLGLYFGVGIGYNF